MTPRLLLALAALGLAGEVRAQEAAPAPRYFVGLGLYGSAFQPLGYHYGVTTFPVQVAGVWQWRPRWALQLGAAYSGTANDYANEGQFLDPATGAPTGAYTDAGRATDRRLSAVLLARRTLTRQATHRLQADALGGLTYEHGSYHETGLYTATNPATYQPYAYQQSASQLLLGLGAGLRLRAAVRLEVLLDVLLNAPLNTPSRTGIQSATTLGLRYRLGPAR